MRKKSTGPVLLFSFLQLLRRTDAAGYYVILVFIIAQLFLTFIKLEAAPFFLYGMFSEKIASSDTFTTMKILINNKPLEFYQSPMREKMLLETNTANYEEMKRNHQTDVIKTRIETRYPFIYNSAVYPFFSRRIYNTAQDQEEYKRWLKKKCLKIAGIPDAAVKVIQTTYLLDRTTLQLNPIKHETLEDL